MQFLVSVIDDQSGLATDSEMAAIDAYNDRLVSEGHWVFAGGLASPNMATVIDGRGEQTVVTDGPYIESKEHFIGFWVITAPDRDVAMTLATEGSRACNRMVEVRPFLGR